MVELHRSSKPSSTMAVAPRYANKKYNLYYPKACPEEKRTAKCLMTPKFLKGLIGSEQSIQNIDSSQFAKSSILRYIKCLDERLNSPQYEFLKQFHPEKPCVWAETLSNEHDCRCACEQQQPLKSALFEKNRKETPRSRQCDRSWPLLPCRCGKGCPLMTSHSEKLPKRTFHVPGCPSDRFLMQLPKSPVQGVKACPFAPACCPIGDVCPFPVTTLHDPAAPPLPPLEGPRRCPRTTTDAISNPSCPLASLETPDASSPTCPLVKPSTCRIGQQTGCPLLTCSLGSLKNFIFDGNDRCPFCHSKCCPMITPDGPGCPIRVPGNFCPLANTNNCGMRSVLPKYCPVAETNQQSSNATGLDETCSAPNPFDCPALQKKPLAEFLRQCSPSHNSAERTKNDPIKHKVDRKPDRNSKAPNEPRNSNRKLKINRDLQARGILDPAIQQTHSVVVEKAESVMRKAASTGMNVEHTCNSLFEVSMEPLPHPPMSDNDKTRSSFRSQRSAKRRSRKTENAALVKAALPNESNGFDASGKSDLENCLFLEPQKSFLDVPKCSSKLVEPPSSLAGTTKCGATACSMAGMALAAVQKQCPLETPQCELFPKGHCPMEEMNMCECKYPVSPCLERLVPDVDAEARQQYCSRLNCCMGLPLPPTKPSAEFEADTWYALAEVLPGDVATKKYLQVQDYPPEPEFFVSINKERQHPAWNIIRHNEGYKQCKEVKALLDQRGPSVDVATQFRLEDLPDDEEIHIVEQNLQNRLREIECLMTAGVDSPRWTDI